MQYLAAIIYEFNLVTLSQAELENLKNQEAPCFCKADSTIYKNSLYCKNSVLYFIGTVKTHKALFLVSSFPFQSEFTGKSEKVDTLYFQTVEFTFTNVKVLHKLFPFTAPVSLRSKKTTIGCGDRLGCATPGQIRAVKQFALYPVLAQQSIRELNFTRRTYYDVITDTSFLVFQEGYERGYGADGDHLKTITDIRAAITAGFTMITLDLSEVMQPDAVHWEKEKINNEFDKLSLEEKKRILDTYADKVFPVCDSTISISYAEVLLCTALYRKALDFSLEVDQFLKNARGNNYDLEISIDETTTPTLPSHHLFIIKELQYRNVAVNSLAPRFTGEFQKAIDYIGDIKEFGNQFSLHCKIAKAYGGYKISVHSGSDKFSIYPVVGAGTALDLHLKTAGTSWLEAVRCIAISKPALYRKLHKKAFLYYAQARQFYHITADIARIPDIDTVEDTELPAYLDMQEARQLLHITYGGLLTDPGIREDFFRTLTEKEALHYKLLQHHFEKHIQHLGIPQLS